MTYCVKCGAELREGARFCPKCGVKIVGVDAKTGFERTSYDVNLQDHWVRRVIAVVIDGIVAGIGSIFLTAILLLIFLIEGWPFWRNPWNWLTFPFIMGLINVLYFTITESRYGYTLGKRMLNLKVVISKGEVPNLYKTFIRNITKIHWALLLLDVVGGLMTTGDSRQKYSDRIAGTLVT
jgi:uncharacterized RDD family membrane protein YckC